MTLGGGGDEGSGILMRCTVHLENSLIRNFGSHGIEIVATATSSVASRKGNANNWSINNTHVDGCGNHGLYIEGADTNAGYSLGFSGVSNGGYGLYDSSFLGNTHIGAHVANNEQGAYFSDGENAHSVFIGCYTEQPQRSHIRHPAMVIGGLFGANDSSGQTISNKKISPFSVFETNKDHNRVIETRIGWAGKPLTMFVEDDAGWGFEWRESTRTWTFRYAGLNRHTAYHLTTTETGADGELLYDDGSPIGGGEMILPKFLFRNAARKYQVFEAADVIKRLQDLEDEVERLRDAIPT